MVKKNILIIVSALCGAAPFIGPTILWPLILVFLVPLSYLFYLNMLTFKDGLLWGVIFFSVHSNGLFVLINQHGYGLLRFIAPVIFVLYFALYPSFWFYGALKLKKYLSRVMELSYATPLSWFLATVVYFLIIDRYSFWVFATAEGNTLANPLLPLLITDVGKIVTAMFGSKVFLAVLIATQMICSYFFIRYKIVLLVPFIAVICLHLFLSKNIEQKPAWLLECMALYPPPAKDLPLAEKMQRLTHQLRECVIQNPRPRCIIMPESTISLPLNLHQEFIASWYQNGVPESVHIFVGAHRKEGEKTYNTCYWIHGRRIMQHYDKKKPLFFTEKVPAIWSYFSCIEKMFLNNTVMFSPGKQSYCECKISDAFIVSPMICSELFFTHNNVVPENCTIIALVNDSWFSAVYVQKLMELCAIYKALVWQKDILYVSHTRGLWISKSGSFYQLQ